MSEKKQTAVNESAKQKAVEMVERYEKEIGLSDLNVLPIMNLSLDAETRELAKQCALIAVDQIIKAEPILPNNQKPFGKNIQSIRQNFTDANNFWQQVRTEIEKL